MTVAAILAEKGRRVVALKPEDSLAEVVRTLAANKIGALILTDDEGRIAGIISERDVVKAVAADGAASLLRPVSDYMTRDVVFAEPGETVTILMERMTDRRIRHLPVLTDSRLSGVISIGDVVKCQIAEATHEAESLRTYIAAG